MGLDLVEYVVAVEDAFEISIPDADAVLLESPRKLIDYLCAHLGETNAGPPLVQTVFYQVRAAIAGELRIPRRRIHPTTSLAELVPDRLENDVWVASAARLGIRLRDVTHAPVLKWIAKLEQSPSRSIGDVADQRAMMRPAAVKPRDTPWTRAQITEVVIRLLEHEIALDVRPFGLDATFIHDLGMG